MTLEQEIKDHKAPIEPACELDPDCEHCPYPERKKFWQGVWDKFATSKQKDLSTGKEGEQ